MCGPLYAASLSDDRRKFKHLKIEQKQRQKNGIQSRIEGKFGEGKRGYDLNLVKAKWPETSESWIAAVFFVMNIARRLRDYFFALAWLCSKRLPLQLFLYDKEQYGAVDEPAYSS